MQMATNRGIPLLDDDLITNVISMNFSGRFKGNEVKELGSAIIRHMVTAKSVDLFFGQQANFRLSSLPDNYDVIGSQRAFLLYNRKRFQANDELQYRHFLRDLELRGRLQKFYLPEANYTLCKMKSKVMDDTSFIAMSWFTDEVKDQLRSLNLLRKLLSFTANLCAIEEMPVIIAGSFRLSLEEVKQVVYNEFEGFRCYGYRTDKNRRSSRMCNIYVSCPPLKLEEVKPVVSGKIEVTGNKMADRWCHLEDAFYWDPVYGRMLRRTGTSSAASPESPRAISPLHSFDNPDVFGTNDDGSSGSTLQLGECPFVDPHHARPTFPSAEDTLKVLLAESERIKELVSEAETKARLRLDARVKTPGSPSSRIPVSSSAVKVQLTGSGKETDGFPLDFDLEAEARKVSESLRSGTRTSIDEDEEFQLLEKAFSAALVIDNGSVDVKQDEVDQSSTTKVLEASRPGKPATQPLTLEVPSCPLRKMPSYIDLYDEELIDSNRVCYMQ